MNPFEPPKIDHKPTKPQFRFKVVPDNKVSLINAMIALIVTIAILLAMTLRCPPRATNQTLLANYRRLILCLAQLEIKRLDLVQVDQRGSF